MYSLECGMAYSLPSLSSQSNSCCFSGKFLRNMSMERPYRLCTKYQVHTSIPQCYVLLYYKTVVSSETAYVQKYNSDVVYDKCELILSRYVAEAITT